MHVFLSSFLGLHKHEAGSLWDNENVSGFPSRKENKGRHFPTKHSQLTFQHMWLNSPLVSRGKIFFFPGGHTEREDSGEV